MLYCHLQHRNDTIIKTHADFFNNIYLSLYCKGSKRVTQGLRVRGSWRSNITRIFWPHCYGSQRCVFLVLHGCSTRGPAGCLLSLLHLISNFSGPQLIRAPNPFGLVWLSLPQLISNWLQLNWHLTSVLTALYNNSTPTRSPPDLWNRVFNRHQAEINVMQFTGHSLPVHQSMSVLWEFFSSSHFISQFPHTRFPLITAIRMCHLLPVHHLGMAFLAGSKGQNTTPDQRKYDPDRKQKRRKKNFHPK